MVTTRTEQITTPEGEVFDAHVALPEGGTGPGILVVQEIFGVNAYIRERCAMLARIGYVTLAPDAFWRIERNIALGHEPADLERALGYVSRYDHDRGLPDMIAALDHLRGLPEVTGKVGVLGFCFGGTMAYRLACHAHPDAVVSYYGSGIGSKLDQAAGIACPILFHHGARDPYIPQDEIERVAALVASKPDLMEHCIQDAGHAFDNHLAGMFHDPPAAAAAWRVTESFLARHLPM